MSSQKSDFVQAPPVRGLHEPMVRIPLQRKYHRFVQANLRPDADAAIATPSTAPSTSAAIPSPSSGPSCLAAPPVELHDHSLSRSSLHHLSAALLAVAPNFWPSPDRVTAHAKVLESELQTLRTIGHGLHAQGDLDLAPLMRIRILSQRLETLMATITRGDKSAEGKEDNADEVVRADAPVRPRAEVAVAERSALERYQTFNGPMAMAGCVVDTSNGERVCCSPDLERKGLGMMKRGRCVPFDCEKYTTRGACEDETTHEKGVCEFVAEGMAVEQVWVYHPRMIFSIRDEKKTRMLFLQYSSKIDATTFVHHRPQLLSIPLPSPEAKSAGFIKSSKLQRLESSANPAYHTAAEPMTVTVAHCAPAPSVVVTPKIFHAPCAQDRTGCSPWGIQLAPNGMKNGVVYGGLGRDAVIRGPRGEEQVVLPSAMRTAEERVLNSSVEDKLLRFPQRGDELTRIEVGRFARAEGSSEGGGKTILGKGLLAMVDEEGVLSKGIQQKTPRRLVCKKPSDLDDARCAAPDMIWHTTVLPTKNAPSTRGEYERFIWNWLTVPELGRSSRENKRGHLFSNPLSLKREQTAQIATDTPLPIDWERSVPCLRLHFRRPYAAKTSHSQPLNMPLVNNGFIARIDRDTQMQLLTMRDRSASQAQWRLWFQLPQVWKYAADLYRVYENYMSFDRNIAAKLQALEEGLESVESGAADSTSVGGTKLAISIRKIVAPDLLLPLRRVDGYSCVDSRSHATKFAKMRTQAEELAWAFAEKFRALMSLRTYSSALELGAERSLSTLAAVRPADDDAAGVLENDRTKVPDLERFRRDGVATRME